MHQTRLAVCCLFDIALFTARVAYRFRLALRTCCGLHRRISSYESGPRTCLRKRNPDPTPRRQGYKAQTPHHKSELPPRLISVTAPGGCLTAENAQGGKQSARKEAVTVEPSLFTSGCDEKEKWFWWRGGGGGGGGGAGVGWQLEQEKSL